MLVDVKVPQLSESVAEATLVSWHKKAGEFVKRDENLVDIETDKVVLETPAPQAGVLVKIVKIDGGTVTSNEIIAQIDTDAKADGKADAAEPEAKAPAAEPELKAPGAQGAVAAAPCVETSTQPETRRHAAARVERMSFQTARCPRCSDRQLPRDAWPIAQYHRCRQGRSPKC